MIVENDKEVSIGTDSEIPKACQNEIIQTRVIPNEPKCEKSTPVSPSFLHTGHLL